jgi:hypothetical protein
MLDSSPIVTSPVMVTPSATKALSAITGNLS